MYFCVPMQQWRNQDFSKDVQKTTQYNKKSMVISKNNLLSTRISATSPTRHHNKFLILVTRAMPWEEGRGHAPRAQVLRRRQIFIEKKKTSFIGMI